jgi:hypothetical protein
MQFGVERALTDLVRRRQRFIEDRKCAIEIVSSRFGFSQSILDEAVEDQGVLIAQKFDAATHVREPALQGAAFSLHQALEKDPERSPHR